MAEFLLDFFKLLKWSNKPLRLELSSFLSTKISAVSRTMEDFFIFLIGKIVSNKPLGLGLETPPYSPATLSQAVDESRFS